MSSEPDYLRGVAAYYADKTASIIAKYGPGPRVHFHTGLVEEPVLSDSRERAGLRAAMVKGQEALLAHIQNTSPVPVAGRVLDVGCGLGGGALWWAARPEVELVTAITIEPSHVDAVRFFAANVGLSDKVEAQLLDAHACPWERGFDHVMAIESSCYLDRRRWASVTHRTLRPGGVLHVVDCFRAADAELPWFDTYWKTRLGSLSEYAAAFAAAGLHDLSVEDLAPRALGFWDLSCAWIALAVKDPETRRLKLAAHRQLQRALRDGSLRYLRLTARS